MGRLISQVFICMALSLIHFSASGQEPQYLVIREVAQNAIAVSASSTFSPEQTAVNLINGSGLHGDFHDNHPNARTMWHTRTHPILSSPVKDIPLVRAWVRFDFSKPTSINKILIWNHNQQGLTGRGFKSTIIWGTADGVHWQQLRSLELPDAKTMHGRSSEILIHEHDNRFMGIIITARSNWGGDVYGLSEVKFLNEKKLSLAQLPFPEQMQCQSTSIYRYCKDGKPGRVVLLTFNGRHLYQDATIQITAGGRSETTAISYKAEGRTQVEALMPSGVGVDKGVQIQVNLMAGTKRIKRSFELPRQRQWTVYIYPHSHVDIGYTNTQANVEIIHERNLMHGTDLAKQTANYPKDARYLWNPEVIWPVERFLNKASLTDSAFLLDAIRKGYIHLDAGYINANTSLCSGEELYRLFSDAKRISKITGVPVKTMTQTDIPGMSWGIVPMAAAFGIKYIFAPFNGSGRIGLADKFNFRPFWWLGQDGISKVLFLQPGDYTPGAKAKGYQYWPLMVGQKDPDKLIQIVKTDHPRDNFIDAYLWPKLKELEADKAYPYNIFPMTWAMADNTPIDADLPDAVKSWNESYAFPHLVIASATQIMSRFEEAYGDIIPTYKGDFTEYWTDGSGTAARETSMNRHAKERLIQADILWSMLHPSQSAPRRQMQEAWRNVIMGTEHTWGYMDPAASDMQDEIWSVKQNFFNTADKNSHQLIGAALQPYATQKSDIITVFNTLSWNRSGLITLNKEQSEGFFSVRNQNKQLIPSQRLSTGELVFMAKDIPALGAVNFFLGTQKQINPVGTGVMAKGNILDNGLVRVSIDPETGDITSLKDKTGYEFVNVKDPANVNSYRYLLGNGQLASSGPQYATDVTTAKQPTSSNNPSATGPTQVQVAVKENGPLLASIVVHSKADGCKKLVREIRIIAGSPQVEINNTLDKIAIREKEGIHFGFAFNLPEGRVRYDIPWSVVELEKDQLVAANRNWMAVQRWVDISNKERGITWCSLDAPLFESGHMTANIMGDAFHSPKWIQKLPYSSTIFSWALNNHWYTNFPLSQEGILKFSYRILPHENGYDRVQANRYGLEKSRPLIAVPVKEKVAIVPALSINNPNVFLSNIKTSADGHATIIHLRSLSDKKEQVRITFSNRRSKSIEFISEDKSVTVKGSLQIIMLPHGLTSFRME